SRASTAPGTRTPASRTRSKRSRRATAPCRCSASRVGSMRTLRLPLRLYIGAVIAAGAAALGAGGLVLRPESGDVAVALVLLALATAAQLRPVHLTQKTKVTVEDAATSAAALL